MPENRDERLDELKLALGVYAEHAEEVGDDRKKLEALLRKHESLRDLLEPMFLDDCTEEDPDATTGSGGRATSSADGDDEVAGRIIGDFRLLAEIGRGGMGIVYEARQISLRRSVALKILAPDRVASPQAIVRFQREAAAAAALDHPGLVKVHATGGVGGDHFIAMDFVEGAPLNRVLDVLGKSPERPPSIESLNEAVDRVANRSVDGDSTAGDDSGGGDVSGTYIAAVVSIVAEVADALEHAHSRGVIHRDVKPANIIVRRDGSAVLTDFGIARQEDSPALTATGDIAGTPFYISPEQVQSWRNKVDHRTDIFSLGVTLYELLTLSRPFNGTTSQQVMNKIVTTQPIGPQRLNADLPSDLAAIVMMALEKDPERRYQSAALFAEDLRAFLTYRTVSARAPGPVQRAIRWAQREPLKMTLVVVCLLSVPVLTGAAGYWYAIQPTLRAGETSLRTEKVEAALSEGFLMIKQTRLAEARRAFDAALALDGACLEAVAGHVLAGVEAGGKAVVADLDRHRSLLESEIPLRRMLAYVYRRSGDAERAKAVEQDLPAVSGPLDRFIAGITEIHRGHSGDEAAFARAIEHLGLAVLTSERQISIYHYERAHAMGHLFDGKSAESAKSQIRQAVTAMRDLWPDADATRFWSAFAIDSVDPELALELLENLVEREPGNAHYLSNLGTALMRVGELTRSEGVFERAVQAQSSFSGAWRNLGVVRQLLGKLSAAEQAYLKAAKHAPRDPIPWVNLAMIRSEVGQIESAQEAADRAMTLDPDEPESQFAAGLLQFKKRDYPAAIETLRKSIAGRVDTKSLYYLAVSLNRTGDRKSAIATYRKVIDRKPDHSTALSNCGFLLFEEGDHETAAEFLRRSIAADPKNSFNRRNLFAVIKAHGTKKEIFALCSDWRERFPEDPYAWSKSAYAMLWYGPGARRRENAVAALSWAKRGAQLAGKKNPRMAHVLGMVQFHAGQLRESEATLQAALDNAIELKLPKRGVQGVIAGTLKLTRDAIAARDTKGKRQ